MMDQTDGAYELLFVNDGSRDRTLDILKEIALKDVTVKYLDFFLGTSAIKSQSPQEWIMHRGNAIVIIDADLQDPPELILDMIRKWQEGFDVVYAKTDKNGRERLSLRSKQHVSFIGCYEPQQT
ncbi:hypothetical protein GCM10020331_001230 [Ectobacillus funiculus]